MPNIIDVTSASRGNVPQWGNAKQYIAVHYLGVVGQNNKVDSGGYGAHYYIYWDGTIYKAADHDAVLWQVGTAGYYTQKHPYARNSNTIGIEMCPKCDGNAGNAEDPYWYFTEETQKACVELVKYLMQQLGVGADHVLRHYDIVNKYCPAPYCNNNRYRGTWTWDEFKAKLTGGSVAPSTPSGGGSGTYGTGLYKVNVDDLAIRTGPSTKYTQCGSITDKGSYTITEVSNTCWGKLLSGAGWICIDAEYCTASGSAGSNAPESSAWHAAGTATCTDTGVNVRQTPGGTVIGQLGQGNRFEVDGQVSAGWVHVKVAGIGIGWVSDQYVLYDTAWKAAGTATSTADGVRVRQTPNGTILGQVNTGNRFEVDGQKSGEWVHVKVAGIGVGYIHQDYVRYD